MEDEEDNEWEDYECCDGTGHADGCESREPAWDIGDLVCRYPCTGCCPEGHTPTGLQAMQDAAAIDTQRFFKRTKR